MAIDPLCEVRISNRIVDIAGASESHVFPHDGLQTSLILAAFSVQLLVGVSKISVKNDVFLVSARPACARWVSSAKARRIKVDDVRINLDVVIFEICKGIGMIEIHDFLDDFR